MSEKSYASLKASMLTGIANGEYKPHDRLPSQRELGAVYGLSHMSVRRAINELITEGVIYTRPGKGLYVAEPKREAELGALYSFTEDMAMRGMTASSRILNAEITAASTALANMLQIVVGAPVAYLRRLRLADGEPMAIQTSHLPLALCPNLFEHNLESQSLFAVLRERYHLNLVDGQRSAEAALASEEEASLLHLTLPAALLVTEQITYIDDDVPVEFVRSVYRADRYRLSLS